MMEWHLEHTNVNFEPERFFSVSQNYERCFLFMEILIVFVLFCSKHCCLPILGLIFAGCNSPTSNISLAAVNGGALSTEMVELGATRLQ